MNKGDELEVVVLSIDFENRRISLGHKQVNSNPWEQFAEKYQRGTKVEDAVIAKVTEKGLFAKLPLGAEAFVPVKELNSTDKLSSNYVEGNAIQIVILEFDEAGKSITASEKDFNMEFKTSKSSGKSKSKDASSGAPTIGEMSGLADLKAKLVKQETVEKAEAKSKKEKSAKANEAAEAEEKKPAKAKKTKVEE